MLPRVTGTDNSPFSSQQIGDGFIKLLKTHNSDSPEMSQAIDFVAKSAFQFCFGSNDLVDLLIDLIAKYPEKSAMTNRLLTDLIGSPVLLRVADLLETIPESFFDQLPSEIRSKLAEVFRESLNPEVARRAAAYCESRKPEILFDFNKPIVSLSDVFNENISDIVDNPSKSLQVVEQFQPFSAADVVDFVWNLVNDNSPIKNSDKSFIVSLLRPFKSAKVSLEQLVSELDKESLRSCSQSSVQLLLTCLKEVSGARTVQANLFLGKWKNPLTQLNFLTQIISMSPLPVVFPKPPQIARAGPVIIGDFKADHWRCSEFVETLAYLYDYKAKGVDEIIKEGIEKGPALLLLVLAQGGKASGFAAHLARLLLMSPTQYMPGFTALWAANPQFLVDVVCDLYENHNSLLGRIVDMIDDLGNFDTFVGICRPSMAILLHIAAFFRRGNNFRVVFAEMYKKDKTILKAMLKVFDNPSEFGLNIPMKSERKLVPTEELISADLLFFNFVDEIYNDLDPSLQQKVQTLFDKCLVRTPKMLHFTFNWRQKNPPQSPKSPLPVKDSDYLEFAVTPDTKCINRFELYVKSLLSEIPRDKNTARTNGHAVGKLLAQDLMSYQNTSTALQMIDQALSTKENSSQFAFATSALEEMPERLDLYAPFAKHLLSNPVVDRHCHAVFESAKAICSVEPEPIKDVVQEDVELTLDYRLARFAAVDFSADPSILGTMNSDFDNNAVRTVFYLKSQILSPMPSQPNVMNAGNKDNCLEAAGFWVHRLLTAPDARVLGNRILLTRLGRWIGQNTLAKSSVLLARIVDVPKFLLYGYRHSRLCLVVPFVHALFEQASPVFMPPNPWTLSVLSILSGFVRLPYLRYSIYSAIMSIFERFKISPCEVEPYPLHRLPFGKYYDSDFLYPPIQFGSDLSAMALSKLYDGDIAAVFNVVNRHVIISPQTASVGPMIVREIAVFVYTKVPSIAESAASTAFALVLKDFARSCDSESLKRHAKALVTQLVNALSMAAVALLNDPHEGRPVHARRSALNQNCKWVDLLVRQLALKRAWLQLSSQLKPMQRLRVATVPFWDVKSFPPAVAMKVPIQLWPQEITEQGTYTRKLCEESLMPTGIYECFDVDSHVKNAYNGITANPLPLSPIDAYDVELPINKDLARFIFDNFIVRPESGMATGVRNPRHFPQFPVTSPEITIVATLVFCFQPLCSKPVADYGESLVQYLLGGLQREAKEKLQPQVHFLLWQRMPCMRVYTELVKQEIVNKRFVEVLAMKYIDGAINTDVDFSPLVDLVCDEVTTKVYPSEREKLLSFLCTHTFQSISKERLEKLQNTWKTYRRYEQRIPYVQKLAPSSQTGAVFRKWMEIRDPSGVDMFIHNNQHNILDRNSRFWDALITESFATGHKAELVKILCAAIVHMKDQEANVPTVLQNFLREIFQKTVSYQITMSYFASVMAAVTMQLRVHSTSLAKMFGGFLNDIQSGAGPLFIGAWIHLLPLVIQPLLLDDEVITPTAKLVSALLLVLNRFPVDWGSYPQYRKVYKSILRIMLLLVHDAPRFVTACYFDFVTAMPLSFKKLRNIVLACSLPHEVVQPVANFLANRNTVYDSIISGQYEATEKLRELVCDEWMKNGNLSLFEVGKIVLYTFKVTGSGEPEQPAMQKHTLWQLVKCILVLCKNEASATTVVEVLLDQLRYDCPQTRFFSALLMLLWTQDMNWDGVTIQTIIFWVLASRTRGMEVVPLGVQQLRQLLDADPAFQALLANYTTA